MAAADWMERADGICLPAGFVLVASRAVHDKQAPDATFTGFFPAMLAHSDDERIYVKEAINWALRQVGKRNEALRLAALDLCDELTVMSSPSARWIAADARRELSSPAVFQRLQRKAG